MSLRVPVPFVLLRELARYPFGLLALCLALLGVSLVVLRSAALAPDGDLLPFFQRQIVWSCAGLAVFGTVSLCPYRWLGRRSGLVYALGLVALAAVFVLGSKVNGSRRWFSLGPVRVQPSEFT
ncbi:MAG: hypothetical protein D6731_03140, partial [Planctomycetota bacterium]